MLTRAQKCETAFANCVRMILVGCKIDIQSSCKIVFHSKHDLDFIGCVLDLLVDECDGYLKKDVRKMWRLHKNGKSLWDLCNPCTFNRLICAFDTMQWIGMEVYVSVTYCVSSFPNRL